MTGHYTSHRGALHHFPWGPYAEEQVVASEGGDGYIVARDKRCFDGADMLLAQRHKPGVCIVHARWGNRMFSIYTPDELLPDGVAPTEGGQQE